MLTRACFWVSTSLLAVSSLACAGEAPTGPTPPLPQTGWQTDLGVGPNLRLGDDRYMSALYGVTPRESTASGLTAFDAGSGLKSVAVQGPCSSQVGNTWRLTTIARLGQLVNDAGDSSLTDRSTQLFFVAALTRRF